MERYFIGWEIGALLPGAPYTILPVAASLLKAGSGIAPVMTMVLSSSIGIALTRVPFEITFVGWKFSTLRILTCIMLPLLVGCFTKFLNQWLKFFI